MKKNSKIAFFLALLSVSIVVSAALWRRSASVTKKSNDLPTYNICISSYSASPFTEKTLEGFISHVRKSTRAHYEIHKFNAFLDRTLLRSQAEQILLLEPDLIFTTGGTCSQMAKELTRKRNKDIPIVFGGVSDPVGIGLIDSEESSGNNLAGVTGISMSVRDKLDILFTVVPTIHKAVIISNIPEGTTVEEEVREISSILKERNVEVDVVAVSNTNEVNEKAKTFLVNNSVDVLICLRDDTTISCMDSLAKMCDQEGTVIFSQYLDGVPKGATLGLGLFERDFGTKSAKLAIKILENGMHPSQLPLVKIKPHEYELHINSKAASLHKVKIDPKLFSFIKNVKMV